MSAPILASTRRGFLGGLVGLAGAVVLGPRIVLPTDEDVRRFYSVPSGKQFTPAFAYPVHPRPGQHIITFDDAGLVVTRSFGKVEYFATRATLIIAPGASGDTRTIGLMSGDTAHADEGLEVRPIKWDLRATHPSKERA